MISLEDTTLFVRMKPRIDAALHQVLTLHQLANLSGDQAIIKRIGHLAIYQIQPTDGSRVQIDIMTVITSIHSIYPNLDIQVVGSVNSVVYVRQPQKRLRPAYIALVWLLLFVGSGLAVMNFHEDVSMRAVHIRLYYLVTGEETFYPLWLQIPYSLGLGIGMVLFFNHFFKKRFNDEPSPLDVEMFNYQQNLDQYVVQKDKHDH
ncbi:stage V sporulation protein AA [Alkalihalobacillus sp. FSL R5-0424]